MASDIHIGIVAYHPDLASLADLIAFGTQDGHRVWLFINSPLGRSDLSALKDATVLNRGQNHGLGTAYNCIAEAASYDRAKTLLLLDQDSIPPPGMAKQLRQTFAMLRSFDERPAVVGAHAISTNLEQHKPPRIFHNKAVSRHASAWPAEFVISSGSLIDLAAYREIGPFREDFFIDAIDLEWCFRAQSVGYTCWIDDAVEMPHQLGQGVIRLPILDMRLARQEPSRLYTYARNQMAMLRLQHVPWRWKRRIIPYLMLQSVVYIAASAGKRRNVLRAFKAGISDGLHLRLGPGQRESFDLDSRRNSDIV